MSNTPRLTTQQVYALHLKRLKDENDDLRLRLRVTSEVLAVEIHRRCVAEGKVGTWQPEVNKAQERITRRLKELRRDDEM